MKNKYTITMPSPEVAMSFGVKLEGLNLRIAQFLTGIAFGLDAVDSAIEFDVVKNDLRTMAITVTTDSIPLMDSIREHFVGYGVNISIDNT
jgi:hypothetical protein